MLDLDLKDQYHRSDHPSLTTKYKLKYILVETWSLVIPPRRFKQTELHVSTSMWILLCNARIKIHEPLSRNGT